MEISRCGQCNRLKERIARALKCAVARRSGTRKAIPKFLREEGQPSILLAYFSDRLTKQDVTLTQVLWMDNGSAKKFFVVADAELSIANDFARFEHIADLKKQLKAIRDIKSSGRRSRKIY